MSPDERALIMGELGKLHGSVGRIEAAAQAHERADERRHVEVCDRLARLERGVEETGKHELARTQARVRELEAADVAEAAERRRRRRDVLERAALLVVGALVSAAVGAGAAHVRGGGGAPETAVVPR